MAKRSPLTIDQRAEILVQNGQNATPLQISRSLGIPRTTVISFLNKYKLKQTLLNNAGHPKRSIKKSKKKLFNMHNQTHWIIYVAMKLIFQSEENL